MSIYTKQPIFGVEIEALSTRYAGYRRITQEFNQAFGFKGSITSDSSIRAKESHKTTFEWISPPLPYKPITIQKYLNGLHSLFLDSNDYFTNKSCAFHTHISFEGMTKYDLLWIYAHLTLDEKFRNQLSKCKNIKFISNKYANFKLMNKLKQNLSQKELSLFFKNIRNKKMECFRLHPQGTLEWRGPRNFLNRKNKAYLRQYFTLLRLLINRLHEYLLKDVLPNGITRELFNESLLAREKETNYSVISFPKDKEKKSSKRTYKIGQDKKVLHKIFNKHPQLAKLSFTEGCLDISNNGDIIWKSGKIDKRKSDPKIYKKNKIRKSSHNLNLKRLLLLFDMREKSNINKKIGLNLYDNYFRWAGSSWEKFYRSSIGKKC